MPANPPLIPGRACPQEYRYGAGALAAQATLRADSLWIAGGLYGNTLALRRLEEMFCSERGDAAVAAFGAANVRVFASSHTCLPVLQAFEGTGIIVNNGAAGMPNFAGADYGLATRISIASHPLALYGTRLGLLHVEAIPIDYDASAWREAFLAQWPEGSDAHASYWQRITQGPRYGQECAMRAA